jgi:hypothetical protein
LALLVVLEEKDKMEALQLGMALEAVVLVLIAALLVEMEHKA